MSRLNGKQVKLAKGKSKKKAALKKFRRLMALSSDGLPATQEITTEQWGNLFAAVKDQEFKDCLTALRETGCRPSEVRRVTASDVKLDQGTWVLEHHETCKKTGLLRVVYLTPTMIELCKRLISQ